MVVRYRRKRREEPDLVYERACDLVADDGLREGAAVGAVPAHRRGVFVLVCRLYQLQAVGFKACQQDRYLVGAVPLGQLGYAVGEQRRRYGKLGGFRIVPYPVVHGAAKRRKVLQYGGL